MGGKTQQRVAGNAKPSNSGRIRELLINQQVGASSIITFSSLATKKQEQQTQQPQLDPAKKEDESPKASSSNDSSDVQNKPSKDEVAAALTTISNQPTTTTTTSTTCSHVSNPKSILQKLGPRLVLRRVGNRDLYTRVRFSEDSTTSDGNDSFQSAVDPSEAGVKKPPQGPLDQCSTQTTATSVEEVEDAEKPDGNEGDTLEVQEDSDEKLDFIGMLDKLETLKALVEQQPHSSYLLTKLSVESLSHEANLLKMFRILLQRFTDDMSIEDWDLMGRSLDKWVNWISKAEYPLRETHQAEFCVQVFEFIHQLIICAERLKKNPGEIASHPMIQLLLDDWANFKSSSMFLDLITLYLKLIAAENSKQPNPTIRLMIEALAHIIILVDPKVVLSHHSLLEYLDTKVEFDQEFKRPKNSVFCSVSEKQISSFAAICGLLRSTLRVILVTAHAITSKTMDAICENAQSSTLIQDHEDVDDALIFPPEPLMAILTSKDAMMSALLSDYRVGDISVTIEPNTDSYACTLSYLFAWDLAIRSIVGVDKEVGQCIIHSLKRIGLIQRLLDNVFILLPPLEHRDSLNFKIESSDKNGEDGPNPEWTIDSFLKSPLSTTIKRPVNEIELVALHIYFSVASHMPVTVRKWYNNNANKRLCNLVNEYTVKHISRVICALEMESVQEKCQERANRDVSKNLIIKARPSAKEVYALYTRDEFKMELTIKLPQNYPLGPVQIDGGKRVGVTDVKWRSWLLQLTTFLSHQNGPILDGIDLWRKNIDKRFEGVEKCTICFSILHSNYQLPKKKCQTCANMFHNLCLYKWFESSGNSTCPLCRNPW